MKSFTLSNGDSIPGIGLGTWKSQKGEVAKAVTTAIEAGYRHLDCAHIYGNEAEIGDALSKCFMNGIVQREDLWITSKLWNESHRAGDVLPAVQKTLSELSLEYLDLYLIHWPVSLQKNVNRRPLRPEDFISKDEVPLTETWAAMEELVDAGLCRHIGVSNFNQQNINTILSSAKHSIASNQIELHPYLQQNDLIAFCHSKNITVTAYSPLGSADRPEGLRSENDPVLLEDPVIMGIAKKKDATPAQVLIAWAVQRGTIVIPKSVTQKRIQENLSSKDVVLGEEDMSAISELDKNLRYVGGKFWVVDGSPYTLDYLWGK